MPILLHHMYQQIIASLLLHHVFPRSINLEQHLLRDHTISGCHLLVVVPYCACARALGLLNPDSNILQRVQPKANRSKAGQRFPTSPLKINVEVFQNSNTRLPLKMATSWLLLHTTANISFYPVSRSLHCFIRSSLERGEEMHGID